MTLWALLCGLPFIIGGWQRTTRKQNARYAATEAPQAYIRQEKAQAVTEFPSEAEREALRRDDARSRVRFK